MKRYESEVIKRRGIIILTDEGKEGGVERGREVTKGFGFFDDSKIILYELIESLEELHRPPIRPKTFIILKTTYDLLEFFY